MGAHRKRNPTNRREGGARETDLLAGEIGTESKTDAEQGQLPRGETAFDHGAPGVRGIYNGRDFLGSVAIGRSIRAVTPDGLEIGRFTTIEEARAAVVRHALGGRP